jgi:hypothetical protein
VRMRKINRREAIQKMILGVGAITLPSSSLISAQQQKNPQQNLEHLLIQDKENFDANPRIFFNNKNEAIVNILPTPGKNLEVELYVNEPDAYISSSRRVARKINVNDSLDIPFNFWPTSKFKYQV